MQKTMEGTIGLFSEIGSTMKPKEKGRLKR